MGLPPTHRTISTPAAAVAAAAATTAAGAGADPPASLQQMAAFGGPPAWGRSRAGSTGMPSSMWGGSGAPAFAAGLASPGAQLPAPYLPSSFGAGMAGAPGGSSVFLSLLQPQALGAGMQQQFGFSLSLQPELQQVKQEQQFAPSAFHPPQPIATQQPAAQLALRPIRTRAAAAAATVAGQASSGATGGAAPPAPAGGSGSGSGGPGLDLAGFLLSPLAASLLSPLGLNGSPAGEQVLGMARVQLSRDSRPACMPTEVHFCPPRRLEGLAPEPPVHRPAGAPAVQRPGR